MIKPLSLAQIENYCQTSLNAQLHNGDVEFDSVNTDTRTLIEGQLFVALRGDNFDAHDFLHQAVAKKVCGVVVEKFNSDIAIPQLVVNDTLLALGYIAQLNRNNFDKPVLAITGSSGKTTVKTMIASILAECGNVHATKGNLNNHIGVPLTLLQLNAHHDFAVIEMGASAIGEIAYLCSLAKPQVTMINNVMPAHIAGFGSIEGVATAKGEIYKNLTSSNIAVINVDEKFANSWLSNIQANVVRVSLRDESANCFSRHIEFKSTSVSFELCMGDQSAFVELNSLGEHSVRNALMAAAMAYSVGANLQNIKHGLEKFSPVGGRMSRHLGVNQSLVIDDSYNANPGSVRAAIDVLAAQSGMRILVLGDLGELGENEVQLHASLGEYAQSKSIDHFFTLGKLSEHASKAFGMQVGQYHFTDRDALISELKSIASNQTTILIKGSRSSKMDLVVKALCSDGENH